MTTTNPIACTCGTEDHTHDGGCPQYVPDPTSPEREQYVAAAMRLGHPRWEAADIAAAVMAVPDAELERTRTELAAQQEGIAFLERNTLPELHRRVQSHQDGKKRWRTRAEKAEARVAALESERQETNGKLAELTVALRAAEAERNELRKRVVKPNAERMTIKAAAANVIDGHRDAADLATRITDEITTALNEVRGGDQ